MIRGKIGYALSPIDFIPDFIPVVGMLDDIILVPVFVAFNNKIYSRRNV